MALDAKLSQMMKGDHSYKPFKTVDVMAEVKAYTAANPSPSGGIFGISNPSPVVPSGEMPGHIAGGRLHESTRLSELGRRPNTQVWRPSQADVESAAFEVIVGKPKYTRGGLCRGTVLDSVDGGLHEIKGGASRLGSTYQLRLQTYRSLREGVPLHLDTTRPINPTFAEYLRRWGVVVTRPGG